MEEGTGQFPIGVPGHAEASTSCFPLPFAPVDQLLAAAKKRRGVADGGAAATATAAADGTSEASASATAPTPTAMPTVRLSRCVFLLLGSCELLNSSMEPCVVSLQTLKGREVDALWRQNSILAFNAQRKNRQKTR